MVTDGLSPCFLFLEGAEGISFSIHICFMRGNAWVGGYGNGMGWDFHEVMHAFTENGIKALNALSQFRPCHASGQGNKT